MISKEPYSNDWQMSEAWNKALESAEQRPAKARNNMWASELGKSPIDIYLKMKGTEPTNPPNARSLRKFEAGNVFEWIVGLVLKRAGILQESQKWVSHQYPGMIEVTGKADYIAGGMPDFERYKQELEAMELPDIFKRGFNSIMGHFKEKYPNGLSSKPLEIKSVSSFMFDSIEKTGQALKIHRLQEFHYLKCTECPEGAVVYICRDDLRMREIPIYNDEATEAEYKKEIELIGSYVLTDTMPPKEKPVVWDADLNKFCKNFNVAYSGYLTMLYGYKDQAEFDGIYSKVQDRWNRVLGRIKTGAKMTPKNLDVIKEIEAAGYNVEELKEKIIVEPEEGENI